MTTETKVEAVAWIDPQGYLIDNGRFQSRVDGMLDFGDLSAYQPLYPASAITALEGEVADRDAVIECKNIDIRERDRSLHEWSERAKAAERRVAELEKLLRAWHAEESRYGVRSQAPGHSHQVPGVWDSDNGPIAGTACAKCALWAQIREIARTESP